MNKQLRGMLITSLGASMWGLCAVAGKYVMGTKGVDPVWMVTLRLLTAGMLLLGIAYVKSRGQGLFDIWRDRQSVIRLFVVAAFAFAVCQTSYFGAINLANAGVITAIQQTAPIFVLLWVLISEKRKPQAYEILILLIVIFGVFMLATGGNIKVLVIPAGALILGFISAITCAMYTILPGKLIERYGTFYASGWGMLLAGMMLVPVAKVWNVSGQWDAKTLLAFGFVVIFGTVTAFAAFLYGVTIVGPLKGSILGLIEPVVAAFSSALILKQKFMVADVIGIAAILGGVLLLAIYKKSGEH